MDIIEQIERWKKNRVASMFDISCINRNEAIQMQAELKRNGYTGYVTTMGKNISVILYLIDNK